MNSLFIMIDREAKVLLKRCPPNLSLLRPPLQPGVDWDTNVALFKVQHAQIWQKYVEAESGINLALDC